MELALEHELLATAGDDQLSGAHFWVSIDPKGNTAEQLRDWKVVFCHLKTGWIGEITSVKPNENLHTPGLSGLFSVEVYVTGLFGEWEKIDAQTSSNPMIGCKKNCASMVEISTNKTGFEYSTKWNVLCHDPDVITDLTLDF